MYGFVPDWIHSNRYAKSRVLELINLSGFSNVAFLYFFYDLAMGSGVDVSEPLKPIDKARASMTIRQRKRTSLLPFN